jgi:LAO/AO transport system kinase
MQDHATDPGVFIRSMATRGHLGGLSLSTPEAIRMLDAVGRAWILVETVGVGQVEVEIAGKADTTVVVLNPGWGDSVQANKAGLMEIADIFVINKADRKGVEETRRDIEQMLELSDLPHEAWRPPIIATIGNTGEGVPALWDAVLEHHHDVIFVCVKNCVRLLRAGLNNAPVKFAQVKCGMACKHKFSIKRSTHGLQPTKCCEE